MDEKKLNEILMNLGIGKYDIAQVYFQEPIRFLIDKEIVTFCYDNNKGCWFINNDVDRVMWFSQFNGIYISFDEHFKLIQKYGSCDLILLDGTCIHINELSLNAFADLIHGRVFEVSVNGDFQYYIYNKKSYKINSEAFKQIVDEINTNSYESLSNKTIRKGKCYILTEKESE